MGAAPAARTGFRFMMTVKGGADRGSTYQLLPPRVTIGRGTDNNIVLNDPRASRQAAVIEFSPQTIVVTDTSSRKSLNVNGLVTDSASIKDGDLIKIGDTEMIFVVEALALPAVTNQSMVPQAHRGELSFPNPAQPPAMPPSGFGSPGPFNTQAPPRQQAPRSPQGDSGKTGFYVILVAVILGGAWLFTKEFASKRRDSSLLTNEQIETNIKSSEDFSDKLAKKRAFKTEEEKTRYEEAQKHYLEGFRDYQKGQFGRALKSFETANAIDRDHQLAKRYYNLAMKKRDEMTAQHTLEGKRYKEKQMFSRCSSAFEKVLEMIPNKDDVRYKQAETLKKECDLLIDERFR